MYNKDIIRDIEHVRQISIVPTMLEVICKSTGMGFAAVARVTEESWVACSVRDEISFGLQPGDELKLETTICNEIRTTGKAVIIDHVAKSEAYSQHHTPRLYGFQSYISVPIIKRNGEIFGTLCAIDTKPAMLQDGKTPDMFKLFAELIAFHLDSVEKLEESTAALQVLDKQLTQSQDENRQYRFISNHNLQEPLRKLRVFSNIIINATDREDFPKVRAFAEKLNLNAQHFSMMIKDLSEFSDLNGMDEASETVDLNRVLYDVIMQVEQVAKLKDAAIEVAAELPVIRGATMQMEQLFYHLITNAIKFGKPDVPPHIKVTSTNHFGDEKAAADKKGYIEIRIQDDGIGIDSSQLERIFDIFKKLDPDISVKGGGIGLSYCRKILRNHGGTITAESEAGVGTTFIIFIPENRITRK